MLGNKTTKTSNGREIIINVEALETRAALHQDGKLEDFFVERPSDERIVGSIFKGRIQNLEDGLQDAFVDIGMKKNAFIHYWDMIPEDAARLEAEEGITRSRSSRRKKQNPGDMAKKFPVGSEIVVQVTKGAIGTKGPRVTANLSVAGRYLVLMPGSHLKGVSRRIEEARERQRLKKILGRLPVPEACGLIVRTAGAGARKTSFARDMRALIDVWGTVQTGMRETPAPCRLYEEPDLVERMVRDSLTEEVDRIIVDSREEYERIKTIVARLSRRAKGKVKQYDGAVPIFDHFDVERQLENALRRKVWLKSGGYIVFDETEALVAIDVNTGRYKGSANQEESILEVNLEAAEEVARQLRLRNVGGLVIIDFIDMKQRRHQTQVGRTLKTAMRGDKARTNILPISDLGLLEMTRQRAEESIRQSNFMDCPYCQGRGKVKSDLSMSVELQRRVNELLKKMRTTKASLKIIVHPSILDRLRRQDEQILVKLEKKFECRLTFVADANMHLEDFGVFDAETNEKLYMNHEHQ